MTGTKKTATKSIGIDNFCRRGIIDLSSKGKTMNYFTRPSISDIIEDVRQSGSTTVRYTVAHHWSGIEVFIDKRWHKEEWYMYVSYGSGGQNKDADGIEAIRAKASAMLDAADLIVELKTNHVVALDAAYEDYKKAALIAAENDRKLREEKARLEAIAKAKKEAEDAHCIFGSDGAQKLADKLYKEIKDGSWSKTVYFRPAGSAEEFAKYVERGSLYSFPKASVERTNTGRASFFLGNRRVKKDEWVLTMTKAVPFFMEL